MSRLKVLWVYLLFGVATTAVNWVIYTVTVTPLGITAANALAWCGAVLFAYLTNKAFVFRSDGWGIYTLLREGVAFIGTRLGTGALEIFLPTALMALGLNQSAFGIVGFWAKAIVSIAVILGNYLISKWIVFKNRS